MSLGITGNDAFASGKKQNRVRTLGGNMVILFLLRGMMEVVDTYMCSRSNRYCCSRWEAICKICAHVMCCKVKLFFEYIKTNRVKICDEYKETGTMFR